MKKNIHPKVFKATVKCQCGETWVTTSTKPELNMDSCLECSGFKSGKQNRVQVDGRIDKFNNKLKKAVVQS